MNYLIAEQKKSNKLQVKMIFISFYKKPINNNDFIQKKKIFSIIGLFVLVCPEFTDPLKLQSILFYKFFNGHAIWGLQSDKIQAI